MSQIEPTNRRSGYTWPPSYPQELVDYTVDILSRDRPSLVTLTAVSKAWQPRSRYHLLANIVVHVPEARLLDFLSFARTCRFGPQYIRRLVLIGELAKQKGDAAYMPAPSDCFVSATMARLEALTTAGSAPDVPLTPKSLHRLLSRMTSLESLVLNYIPLSVDVRAFSGAHPLREDPITPTFKLDVLRVYHTGDREGQLAALAGCLGVFHTVNELHIHSAQPAMAAPITSDRVARSIAHTLPACEVVTLFGEHSQPWTDTYVRALALAPNIAQMRSLDVDSLCAWNEAHLGSLLGRIGGSLRHLGLQLTKFDDPGDTRAFCAALNLAACPGLAHLSIKFDPAGRAPLMALSWTSIAHVVNTVPYAALRRLSLHLGLPFALKHAARAPNALDVVLARFPALRELEFVVQGRLVWCRPGWERWDEGPEADAIRRAFPRVEKKATISFTLAGRWWY